MPAARGNRETIRRRGAHRGRGSRSSSTSRWGLTGIASSVASTTPNCTWTGPHADRQLDRDRNGPSTRRLCMSMDEFFNTYFTGQKELA